MKTFATRPRPEPKRERPCALCGSLRFRPLWELGDFSFVSCEGCGLAQQNPQPEAAHVLARYDESYGDYELRRQAEYAGIELLGLRDLGFDALEAELLPRAAGEGRPARLLDVGCATGHLIERLGARGWSCSGVEPCEPAARHAREVLGLDVRPLVLEEAGFASGEFDLVHASHLIEHLNEPGAFLDEARRILRPGGFLVVTTPNAQGLQARLLGAEWRSAIYDHLYLFSKTTLPLLLRAHGFEVLRLVTWGGWAAGLRPAFLKPALDRLAKRLGFGDVMALLCRPARGGVGSEGAAHGR